MASLVVKMMCLTTCFWFFLWIFKQIHISKSLKWWVVYIPFYPHYTPKKRSIRSIRQWLRETFHRQHILHHFDLRRRPICLFDGLQVDVSFQGANFLRPWVQGDLGTSWVHFCWCHKKPLKKNHPLSKSSRKGTFSKFPGELGKRGIKPPKNWSTSGGWKVPRQYFDDESLERTKFKPPWLVHLVRWFSNQKHPFRVGISHRFFQMFLRFSLG